MHAREPPEARNLSILKVWFLIVYQSQRGFVTYLKEILEVRDLAG